MTEQLFRNGTSIGFGEAVAPPADPRELPSGRSAIDFVDGDLSAFWRLCAHTAVRAGLIGVGLYAVGDRDKSLWLHALGGSLAIETFVLAWVLAQGKR
jgi:hypothetical protein